MKNNRDIELRKKFKEHYKIKFDNTFDIHHMDLNPTNDDWDNLILLPKELHNKFHKCLNDYLFYSNGMNINIYSWYDGSSNWNENFIKSATTFQKIYNECISWATYMEYLKGNTPIDYIPIVNLSM